MDYELLDHDEYKNADHPPARFVARGDTVVLVFRGREGYRIPEARKGRVREVAGDEVVVEVVEAGMMVPVTRGQEIRCRRRQVFEPPLFGDETFLGNEFLPPLPPEEDA